MSGSYPTGDAADPLTDAERADARRFCGYPVYGTGTTDDPFYRFETGYLQLESHLSNLTDAEVAICRARLAALSAEETLFEASGSLVYVGTAAVFTRNPDTIAEHQRFLDAMRRRLCGFLGVPPGPALSASGSTLRLVV